MFAAAMLFSCPGVECSIYSTCKRISQKLLRNVAKFLDLIYAGTGVAKYKVIRANMEELVIKGPESEQDVRTVNSYPSKVTLLSADLMHVCYGVLHERLETVRLVSVDAENGVDAVHRLKHAHVADVDALRVVERLSLRLRLNKNRVPLIQRPSCVC